MKRTLLSFFLTIFLISAAAVFTLNFRPLYYHDISSLEIAEISGYSEHTIRENYDALIDYNSIFHRGSLNLTLPMSEGGRIHFEDVKKIFDSLQILCLISLVVSIFLGRCSLKQKDWKFFRDTSILSLLLPTIAGTLIAANWDKAFVL